MKEWKNERKWKGKGDNTKIDKIKHKMHIWNGNDILAWIFENQKKPFMTLKEKLQVKNLKERKTKHEQKKVSWSQKCLFLCRKMLNINSKHHLNSWNCAFVDFMRFLQNKYFFFNYFLNSGSIKRNGRVNKLIAHY